MSKTWLVSDTHFGHRGMTIFTRDDGSPVRPWDCEKQMSLDMIEYWNDTVSHEDKVYHLGDFVINRKWLYVQNLLNGRKILIKGNHDIFKLTDYAAFDDIRAYHVLDNVLLSHIPVHPSQKGRFIANVHGHTHYRRVLDEQGNPDPFYIPVSVEHTDYRPINWEDVRAMAHSEEMQEAQRKRREG